MAGLVHDALIYESDDELLGHAVPFLREGLAVGAPTLLHAGQREGQLLLSALGPARGLTVLDPTVYANPYTSIRANRARYVEHVRDGAEPARLVGAVPTAAADWSWSLHEAALNHLMATAPVTALCIFDRRAMSEELIAAVERTHTHLNGRPNGAYADAATLARERTGTEVDPLEQTAPQLELTGARLVFARTAVESLARTTALSAAAVHRLGFAVSEVVANAFTHGRSPVRLRAWVADDRVAVAVHDAGAGPEDRRVGIDVSAASPDSLGLHLAYQTCSTVTLEYGPGTFTVHLVART